MTFGTRRALTDKSNWKLEPNLVSHNLLVLFKSNSQVGILREIIIEKEEKN